ncbi:MAG: hypothetical protein NVSMB23_28200 [Myxococcales bacterium]
MATVQEVRVPDIGDFKDIPVIEILVEPGDKVEAEAPLVTLESDKATMDVPAPSAGVVKEVKVKIGDRVSQGTVVLTLESESGAGKEPAAQERAATPASAAPAAGGNPAAPAEQAEPERPFREPAQQKPAPAGATHEAAAAPASARAAPVDEAGFRAAHAGPGVRRLARELGVDLTRVEGQGPKGRILPADVQAYVKSVLSSGAAPGAAAGGGVGLSLAPWPKVDFAKFGPVEQKPLTRLQKIAGPALHRNWVSIPHVTNCDDADITELEAFRVQLNAEAGKQDKSAAKVTMLAFLVKACVAALQKFPNFNSSLDGENLILKRYYNVAFAADTPQGLVVPVIKDADKKGVLAIAKETAELAAKARDGKLSPSDMQGATFTISSLGGIGGTYFTPIINAPEVAILGVCRAQHRPVWDGEKFAPRLILPLSLSWDHRVLDGAAAARFNAHLATLLADVRRLLL